MADTQHIALRMPDEQHERMMNHKQPGETKTALVCRLVGIACDTLEHGAEHEEAAEKHTEHTDKLIEVLETENARLVEEIKRLHEEAERQRQVIADKDEKLHQALIKSYEFTEQAHILVGMAQDAKQITDGGALDVEPVTGKGGFMAWVRSLF